MRCDGCSLSNQRILPTLRHGRDTVILLSHPDGASVIAKHLLGGPENAPLFQALADAGVSPLSLTVTSVLACQPLEGSLQRTFAVEKTKGGESCVSRCASRWTEAIAGAKNVLACGTLPARALRGHPCSATDLRGTGEEIDGRKVFYTLDPLVVSRSASSLDAFLFDVQKAFRFFRGELRSPKLNCTVYRDSAAWADAALSLTGPVVFDYETPVANVMDPTVSWPIVLAVGNEHESHVLQMFDYSRRPLHMGAWSDVRRDVARVLTAREWHGHNASTFDTVVARVHFGVTPLLASDTLVDHISTFTEDDKHNLGWCVSELTDDIEPWKTDKTALRGASIADLSIYAGKDAQKNAALVPSLDKHMRARYSTNTRGDMALRREREMIVSRVGADMTMAGCQVDLARLHAMEQEYLQKTKLAAEKCRDLAGVNPASAQAVSRLLYQTWGLPVVVRSEITGEPSTGKDALKALILADCPDHARVYIEALLDYRDVAKVVGTYLTGIKERLVGARLHGSFTRLPVTGRYSCLDPNMQNWPKFLRVLIIARPGYALVGADSDQLEARVMADLSGARTIWRAIREGLCIHNERMAVVYGDGVWKTPGAPTVRNGKGSSRFAVLRHLIKTIGYLRQYGGGVDSLWNKIRLERVKPETPGGSWFPFRTMTRREVREILKKFGDADPEIEEWWARILADLETTGYVEEPIWGRRRFLPRDSSPTKAYNFPIQAASAPIMHEATIELLHGKPLQWFATETAAPYQEHRPVDGQRVRLIAQIHDQNLLEVPIDEIAEWKARLAHCMTRRRKGQEMVYSAGADAGRSWYGVDNPKSADAL